MTSELPAPVQQALQRLQVPQETLACCTHTDLTLEGQETTQQWFVCTQNRLLVIDQQSTVLADFALEGLLSIRCDARVGSGFVQVEVAEGVFHDVLRYSYALAHKFGKLAHKINARIKHGRRLVIERDDLLNERECPRCGLMLQDTTTKVCPNCLNKGRVTLRLLKMMVPYWPYGLATLALLLTAIAFELAPPLLTRILVDSVFGPHPLPPLFAQVAHSLGMDTPLSWLFLLVLALALTRVGILLTSALAGLISTHVGTRITYDMRQRLYSRLHELSVAYHDRASVGALISRVSQDVEALHGFIEQATHGFLVNLLMLFSIGFILFTMDPVLALLTLIPAPLVLSSTWVYWNRVLPRHYRLSESRSRLYALLGGALGGIRVVKAFAQEQRELARFAGISRLLRHHRITVGRADSTFFPGVTFVFSLGGLIVWFVGGKQLLEGSSAITLGTLMAFIGYLGMFYAPMRQLTQVSQWFSSFTISAYRIFEVLDTEADVADGPAARAVAITSGAIEFRNVTFGYDPNYPVIHEVSCTIKPGEMIGIVGPSGSGKSTLINLLCRFYDPTDGSILIDGVDIRSITLNQLRRQIGVVLQESYLFRGTIRENIAYGRPDATFEEIMQAAKAANVHDDIVRLPDGYDTLIGERGSGLSGGQRQRLSIARALLCNPCILILDEATSSVDTEAEHEIQKALAKLIKGRTTIAIAHRLSTLRNADRIIVMEHGRIKEMGSHTELMQLGGLYHRLVTIQSQLSKEQTIEELAERVALLKGKG